MGPVSATTTIDAPRERVCGLICDLAIRPAFTDHFATEYRLQRLDPVGVGAAARFRLGDSGPWMDTAIEEVEAPHLVREGGRGGRGNLVGAHTVWELIEGPSAGGCEVTVTFWTEPPSGLARLRGSLGSGRWFRRQWVRALARLREVAEAERPVERVTVAGSGLGSVI